MKMIYLTENTFDDSLTTAAVWCVSFLLLLREMPGMLRQGDLKTDMAFIPVSTPDENDSPAFRYQRAARSPCRARRSATWPRSTVSHGCPAFRSGNAPKPWRISRTRPSGRICSAMPRRSSGKNRLPTDTINTVLKNNW